MWMKVDDLIIKTGISRRTLYRKLRSGEWQWRDTNERGRNGRPIREVWVEEGALQGASRDASDDLCAALLSYSDDERQRWLSELQRLAAIVERFALIQPKRHRVNGRVEFTPAVHALCREAACVDPIILNREPHRANPPSPHTLDRWARLYRQHGLLAFVRNVHPCSSGRDGRNAHISAAAVEWVNQNWRNFRNPRHLYKTLRRKALENGWHIPSESWVYRRWRALPAIVRTHQEAGQKAYISKYAPYVPRDYSDLAALQVVCGDHSERDVVVALPDGSAARPWLTVWQDLRTGLIWGWHLDTVPSSRTAGLAYADGVMNFGAQPLSRPDDDFYSYIYTDQGRDYKSHRWDGRVIAVHHAAMKIDGGLYVLCTQRRVGFIHELGLKHLFARGYNAREKPVERFFRDISDWEQNTFESFCGRGVQPDRFKTLWKQYEHFRSGRRSTNPFVTFNEYREALAGFISAWNATEHERASLGGQRIVPLEEYRRLYTTRYEISREALALLLMHADKRRVRKNGVQCFQRHWYYYHPELSKWKGYDVEIRHDDDYSRIYVVLPDAQIVEAQLITPTSLLHPNRDSLRMIAEAAARERRIIREYNLIAQSQIRGEDVEDRVAHAIAIEREEPQRVAVGSALGSAPRARVHQLTRMDRKLSLVQPMGVTPEQVASAHEEIGIFSSPNRDRARVREFDFED